ncbi:uncharacterized protein LOC121862492 [Homarus americanus]|uniref:uncharacterized protein LOC121862492 n=1 Tax=Homarus americanus TaxID=6706 RepID=UPI001C46AAE1|nr:uncharacterized protein LOC121862492 [Homarus americanus]
MFHSKKLGKIKNDKIQQWWVELVCFDNNIVYRPGTENSTAVALSRAFCLATNHNNLSDLHQQLCHPGVTRMAHFIRIRNLPYSVDDVKKVCAECSTCARLKPQFYKPVTTALIKPNQPFERLNRFQESLAVNFPKSIPTNRG